MTIQHTMNENWHLTVWGVRGSFPTPETEYLEYGGNTSCFSLLCGGELVIFDAGSGLAALGDALAAGQYPAGIPFAVCHGTGPAALDAAFPKKYRIHVFLSHFHLDHIMGLFLFQPFYNPDAQIHLYGPACGETGFQERLVSLVAQPLWPLGFGEFPADIHFHQISPGACFPLARTDIKVCTMGGNHPGGSLYYRLEDGHHSLVYALDCELEGQIQTALADFVRKVDLCVWDANFTSKDLKTGWGHSTWEQGLALGQETGVETMLMTHYSREYTDAFLREQERLARTACGQDLPVLEQHLDRPHPSALEQTANRSQPLPLDQAADSQHSQTPDQATGKKRITCHFARERMEIKF